MHHFSVPHGGTIHFVPEGTPPRWHEWSYEVSRRPLGSKDFKRVVSTTGEYHAPPSNVEAEYGVSFSCRRTLIFHPRNWVPASVVVEGATPTEATFICNGFGQHLANLVVEVYPGPAED